MPSVKLEFALTSIMFKLLAVNQPCGIKICLLLSAKAQTFDPSPIMTLPVSIICVPVASAVNLPQPPAVSAATSAAKLVEPAPEAVAVFVVELKLQLTTVYLHL